LTYAELDDSVTRVALNLVRLRLERGERVAFLLTNYAGVEAVLTYLGAHRAGCVALPINARSTPSEAAALARHAEVGTLVYEEAFHRHAEAIAKSCEVKLVQAGGEKLAGAAAFDDTFRARPEDDVRLPAVTRDDQADWLFTSGTTASPNCVMLTHRNCIAHAHMFSKALGIREDDVHLTPFPFFTSSGVHTSFLTSLGVGAHYVMSTHVDAEGLTDELVAAGATVFGAVPSLYTFMVRSPRTKIADLTSIRIAYYGGAPVSPHQVTSFKELFPRAELINTYGQTESGNPGTYLPGRFAQGKAGSIGDRGMPGVQIRVVDLKTGDRVARNGVGELLLKSASVMRGYFKNPDATASVLQDGWLHTGDVVRVDEDGFMFIHDRLKDIIIRGGHNVASLEVEQAISAHEAVLEVAVVAKPHEMLGEDLVAFVVTIPKAAVSAQELRDHCLEFIADYKVPRDFRFIPSLPRNPTGKILKRALRADVVGAGQPTSRES
jgi:acyl-CoA synthetase (AMP-forming)/AMP-acid ligase II